MADFRNTHEILSLCATTSDKIQDLPIMNGQLIMCHDIGLIAFDYKLKRTFYNQVIELETEQDRLDSEPINGKYYFVIETAIFWRYGNDRWKQLTNSPKEIVFVGTEMPELGCKNTIYANTTDGNENISVWDDEKEQYIIVADKTQSISADFISALF